MLALRAMRVCLIAHFYMRFQERQRSNFMIVMQ